MARFKEKTWIKMNPPYCFSCSKLKIAWDRESIKFLLKNKKMLCDPCIKRFTDALEKLGPEPTHPILKTVAVKRERTEPREPGQDDD